ncbi:hypothetical protein GE061_017074 [Apolygus lucorum]|uniref:Secreted protein n=1 Tax=Apolygus lucorum TaxID=248454 RepID=A0A8S9XKP5_APOLU|nr:hypothetical protein GE061_017074 [Apolygus lucorum]
MLFTFSNGQRHSLFISFLTLVSQTEAHEEEKNRRQKSVVQVQDLQSQRPTNQKVSTSLHFFQAYELPAAVRSRRP